MVKEELSLDVEEISTLDGLEELRSEWSKLWRRSASATPFQSPEWLLPWWKNFGRGQIWSLALRQGGELKGLAPFYFDESPSTERRLLLIGTGVSDYLDVVLDSDVERQGAKVFLEHLQQRRHQWDACDFQELRAESSFLQAEACDGWTERVEIQEACPVLSLPRHVEDFPQSSSEHAFSDYLYYRRRLDRMWPVRLECAVEADLRAKLTDLFRLHDLQWAGRGGGVLGEPSVQNFHKEVTAGFLALGILRFYALRIENQVAACVYAFMKGKRMYSYIGGFDPRLRRFSLGTVILGYVLERAVSEGIEEFDFLRGREAYKYEWGARDRLNYRRQLAHFAPQTVW